MLDSLIHLDQIVSSRLGFDKVFPSIGAPQSSVRHQLASVRTEIARNLAILISSEDINIILKDPPRVRICHLDHNTIGRDFTKSTCKCFLQKKK